MPPPLRVIIADDHMLFRQGLKSMLVKLHPDVSVVAEVERVAEIAPTLARTPCDILLLDLQMEDRSALTDIRSFARHVRVVVVSLLVTEGQVPTVHGENCPSGVPPAK